MTFRNDEASGGNEGRNDDGQNTVAEDEQLLDRFQTWLSETREEARTLADPHHPSTGLYDLVESFTALRHEVKLQTKSSRSLQEAAGTALDSLNVAIEEFRSVQPREEQAAEAACRPFVESLADLDEALDRGRRAIEGTLDVMRAAAAESSEIIDETLAAQPFWSRQACRRFAKSLKTKLTSHAEASQDPVLNSLLEGYALIQQRLHRAMDVHGVERIECIGEQADVHSMSVVEVVDDPEQPAGTVVEELRPGFRWHGQVVRFAEVKAVRRSRRSEESEEPGAPDSAGV